MLLGVLSYPELRLISEGSAGTAMPPWKTIISEEDRWHLVNFVRMLPDAE
jgi:mono/diheme cytochrome c family protein